MGLQKDTIALRTLFYRIQTAGRGGIALTRPTARYCSIAWLGAGRLECRFVTVQAWQQLEREIAANFEQLGPVGPGSIVPALLLDAPRGADLTCFRADELGVGVAPGQAAEPLDGELRASLAPAVFSSEE